MLWIGSQAWSGGLLPDCLTRRVRSIPARAGIGRGRLGSYSASEKLGDFGVVEETRGSAQAVTRWSPHRLATGISVAAAGVLLATIWSKVPAGIDVAVAPGGARFSKSFSF